MADLLFELGTEEIPAGFLAKGLVDLRGLAEEKLKTARLVSEEIVTVGTPRRLTLFVRGLVDRQADVSNKVFGPAEGAAFDKERKPTRAAEGFAAKLGLAVDKLTVEEVPGKKGRYLVGVAEEKGRATRELLPVLLNELAHAIPWKKSMRWGMIDDAFVRPVHWAVAIFAGEVVPLELYGVKSGRETRGHRFLAPGAFALDGTLDDYTSKLRAAFVLVDPRTRRLQVEAELAAAQKEHGVKVRDDQALVDEVTNLVEYPKAVVGTFSPEFLVIPPEVIISAMRGHQRYFATEKDGKLADRFVTIAGTITKDLNAVQHGNERVLASRLSDARFFFEEDKETKLEDVAKKLDGVIFQKALGTVGEKVRRIENYAALFPGIDDAVFRRAAQLCKADLLTKMVGEFPDLQGVMGRHYARLEGENEKIADAILEHYLPRGAADKLPTGDLGAALGVADRIDTIVGCFRVNLAPTGSNDAFGLRRAALAVLNILAARGWAISLRKLVDTANQQLKDPIPKPLHVDEQILDFFKGRLRGILVDQKNLPADCVDAALAVATWFDDVPDAVARATAVARLRDRPDFEPLGVAFKRVANILKGETTTGEPAVASFAHASEKALWEKFVAARAAAASLLAARDYDGALRELASIKPAVDKFFDDVLVMDEDAAIRANRLALLGTINATFMKIADFRQLAVK